eukprot:scaffold9501_cov75-Phaeocystis_antarctica.AAC.5
MPDSATEGSGTTSSHSPSSRGRDQSLVARARTRGGPRRACRVRTCEVRQGQGQPPAQWQRWW